VYPKLFYTDLDMVIVVEGYKACLWMLQQGFDNTVALQGSRMSTSQEALLAKHDGWVILFLDNNKAGKEGTDDTGTRLIARGQRVLVCNYPDEYEEQAQPDNLSKDEIQHTLDTAMPLNDWKDKHGLQTKSEPLDVNAWVRHKPDVRG
jgi:DNA primase